MKRILYFLTTIAALTFAASCAKEADMSPVKGEFVEATFTVTLDDATATKAAIKNDAANIDKLVVRAFKKSDGSSLNALDGNFTIEDVSASGVKKFSVKAKLVKNFAYTIGFFAYHDGAPYALGDDGLITMSAGSANDETLDAFYAAVDVTLNPEDPGSMSKSITLTRPLAQVNILSDPADWAAATTSGITAGNLKSSVSIANAPNKLNLRTGDVTGDVTLSFTLNDIPEGTINLAAANEDAKNAKYIAMAYVLSNDTGKNFDITFSVPAISTVGFDGFTRIVNNMPTKRNYRTNLHGDLFTTTGDFTVTIDPAWGGDDNNQDINIPQPTLDGLALPDGYSGNAVLPIVGANNAVSTNVGNQLYFGRTSNSNGAFTYTSTNTTVGTINNNGEFTALSAGTTDVIVHQEAGTQTKAVGDPLSDITIVYHVTVSTTTYAITKADASNGTITVKIGEDEVNEAAENATVIVVATPADGYQLETLTYTPEGDAAVDIKETGSFTMPAKAVTVAATFELIPPTNYTITVTQPEAGGTIAASATSALAGTEITLTPNPAAGYELSAWSVKNGEDDVTVTNNKFSMPSGNVSVTATFTKINYTISTGNLSGGSLSAAATANYGDDVTVTVTPADGKQLKAGTLEFTPEGGSATDIDESTKTFTMPAANVTLSAEFEDIPVTTYSVNIDESLSHGTITANPTTAAAGATVTLTIAPDGGYQLSEIKVNDGEVTVSGSGDTRTFTMPDKDVTVTATFEKIKYAITIPEFDGSSITVDANPVAWGEIVTLTVTPGSGKQLKSGTLAVTPNILDLTDMGEGAWMFTMPQNAVSVAAEFEDEPTETGYSITVTQPTGGTIAVTDTDGNSIDLDNVAKDTNIKIVATANSGYIFDSFTVTGATLDPGNGTTRTFTMPEGNVTVTATFDHLATLSGDLLARDSYDTSYHSETYTDSAGNSWVIQCSTAGTKANGPYQMFQMKKVATGDATGDATADSYVTIPEFSSDIKSIVLSVTDASSTSLEGGNVCKAEIFFSTTNSNNATSIISDGDTSNGTKTITLDFTGKSYKKGYLLAKGAGARVWSLTIIY